eukprot:1180616-Rhodomonas_salina.7
MEPFCSVSDLRLRLCGTRKTLLLTQHHRHISQYVRRFRSCRTVQRTKAKKSRAPMMDFRNIVGRSADDSGSRGPHAHHSPR